MPAISGPAAVAAALLVLAGALKVIDPANTVGALRALRLPASPRIVRVGAGVEMTVGCLAVAVGGAALWGLVALSYVAFSVFVVAAMRRGTMVGSCGCFGHEDTPPDVVHIVVNVGLAAVALLTSFALDGSLLDHLVDDPMRALVFVGLTTVAVYLLQAVYVDLPRARASRHLRSS